jgi:hypothetical protein
MKKYEKIVCMGYLLFTSLWGAPFNDNGNGTITDSATGLIWQKCSAGQGSIIDNCIGSSSRYIWSGAITYCRGLSLGGRSDWRLPNINELRSIIDYTKYNPSIDSIIFPNTSYVDSYGYISSSTPGISAEKILSVAFHNGIVYHSYKRDTSGFVRCVTGP